jgi:protein SCO1/2
MKTTRLIIWGVVAALLLFLAGGLAWQQFAPETQTAAKGKFGGPFTLVDQAGKTVTEKDLKGSPTLLFFGYTHCPDVCPTTLSDLTLAMQKLGDDANKVKVFFVTVDPERDTREVMAEYAQAFDPDFHLLTGTPAQVKQIVENYHVYAEKVPGKNGEYTMNHTAAVYLLDSQGRFVGTLSYQEELPKVVAKIEELIAAS